MTKDLDKTTEALQEDLRSVKKSFDVLLLTLEAEGIGPATEVAARIVDRIDHIVREMKDGYVEKILERKFRPFAEDKKSFADFKAGGKGPSSNEFIDLVSHLESHIEMLDREMRALLPPPSRTVGWIRRHRRSLTISLAIVIAIVAIGKFKQIYTTRGKGLMGEYYSGPNFDKLISRRRDLSIDFRLNKKAPVWRLAPYDFSVRWTGLIRIPSDGPYEFITRSDDGVRLTIDGKLAIDNWSVHKETANNVTLDMKAGHHAVKLEWFQRRGRAAMQLYWRSGNDAQPQLIAPEFLIPSVG